jgi:NADPH:quinone reductase
MKAIAIDDFGVPPRLRDLPVPEPGEGEVLVRVRASSVNGFDVAVADGYLKGMMEHHFPIVLGRDFAGTAEAADVPQALADFAAGTRGKLAISVP